MGLQVGFVHSIFHDSLPTCCHRSSYRAATVLGCELVELWTCPHAEDCWLLVSSSPVWMERRLRGQLAPSCWAAPCHMFTIVLLQCESESLFPVVCTKPPLCLNLLGFQLSARRNVIAIRATIGCVSTAIVIQSTCSCECFITGTCQRERGTLQRNLNGDCVPEVVFFLAWALSSSLCLTVGQI